MDLRAEVERVRREQFQRSDQFSLGEILVGLQSIPDKRKPVRFDFGDNVPTGLDSWRGIYAELALGYAQSEPKTVAEILDMLESAVGQTFVGYKGGDYVMSRTTPVWVANYGESGVIGYKDGDWPTVGVKGVIDGEAVILATAPMDP